MGGLSMQCRVQGSYLGSTLVIYVSAVIRGFSSLSIHALPPIACATLTYWKAYSVDMLYTLVVYALEVVLEYKYT